MNIKRPILPPGHPPSFKSYGGKSPPSPKACTSAEAALAHLRRRDKLKAQSL